MIFIWVLIVDSTVLILSSGPCYSSTVKTDTLQPVWNELWRVKNVPSNAELRVQVLDKDDGPKDDYIGRFTTDVLPGAKEEAIHGRVFKKNKGTFWLKV